MVALVNSLRGLALLATAVLPLFASTAQSKPLYSTNSTDAVCPKPYVRKEWRRLTHHERKSYIKTMQCIMSKPGTAPFDAVTSRYEDFTATHIVQADEVHFVGIFFPYHRFLLSLWEKELWKCGWDPKLGQPFWDWTLDAGSPQDFFGSPIFDHVTGFGGNGDWVPGNFSHPEPGMIVRAPEDVPDRSGGGCIDSGPFAGLSSYLGPGNNTAKAEAYCVRRDFSYSSVLSRSGPARVEQAMAIPKFRPFTEATDGSTLHTGGHLGIGGLYGAMVDKWASPTDPLFYLHHSNLDRAWWSWQQRDPAARLRDFGGPLIPYDYNNTLGGDATLDSVIWAGLADRQEAKVAEVMHIQKGPLCYTYDELY